MSAKAREFKFCTFLPCDILASCISISKYTDMQFFFLHKILKHIAHFFPLTVSKLIFLLTSTSHCPSAIAELLVAVLVV